MNHLCVDVSSYSVFDSLVQEYVIAGGAPAVSFNISDDVDAQSYGRILDDLLANNQNLDRFDKIENPRPDHYPCPILSCYTVRDMDRVCKAIGPFWRVIFLERSDYSRAKNNKICGNMCDFRVMCGIIDHPHGPEWA
ncbi:hypothetical protein TSUD_192700 [Trifolium subterraneum]|uniref:Uncharacterized protein n=1 Tax=Trifolium subterraneum TaxID=3900 RepID=A0A2Z6LHN6_TRISU|nr:hypothetical protein TSUD_192700 [Trifolium subterraneum]